MPTRHIALYGGSFNPPGRHHRRNGALASRRFDEVFVIPCGGRPDKLTTGDIEPIDRAVMCDRGFRGIPNLKVWLDDLERETFTPNVHLEKMFSADGTVIWHVVGSDLIALGREGRSKIQLEWQEGPAIWRDLRWAVVMRPGYPVTEADLPPKSIVLGDCTDAASTDIRDCVFRREPYDHLVEPDVEAYIERRGLYRGAVPPRSSRISLERPRALLVTADRNPRAAAMAERLAPLVDGNDPNVVVAIGGDGTMLEAVRRHWRLRLPFYGINTGHLGHTLNDPEAGGEVIIPSEMDTYRQQLLYVEMTDPSGTRRTALAFNDVWVTGYTSPEAGMRVQAPWVEVSVGGEVEIPRLVADGALVATAAGSTAYARSMGAAPLPVSSSHFVLVGNNVFLPANWSSAQLEQGDVVTFRAIDPDKRPIIGVADSVSQGWVTEMKVRMSRIAAAELAFVPGHDPRAKLRKIQFPAP